MKNERIFLISGIGALINSQNNYCEVTLREHPTFMTMSCDLHPTRLTPTQARFLAAELDAIADRIDKEMRKAAKETPPPKPRTKKHDVVKKAATAVDS